MTDAPPAKRRWCLRLALLTLSTVVTLLGCELWARLRVQRLNEQTLQASLSRPVTMSREGQASLGDVIQLSANDRIAYELRPNLPGVIFKDKQVTTNSHGFRSPETPHAAQPDEVTIVAIGDSILFGHGVADGECYLDQLQVLLSERRPEQSWRVINTGVPGYNTVMEVETLAAKGLAFDPDLVLVGVVGNDYEPPVYVRDAEDPWDWSRSFFLEFVRQRLDGGDEASYLRKAGLNHRGNWSEEMGAEDPNAAPTRYAALYGKDAFLGAVQRLAALKQQHGFELYALATPPYDTNKATEMLAAMAAEGITTGDFQHLLDTDLEAQTGRPFNIADYMQSDLVVNPGNGHPSVRAHGLIAEQIYTELEELGILDKLCK